MGTLREALRWILVKISKFKRLLSLFGGKVARKPKTRILCLFPGGPVGTLPGSFRDLEDLLNPDILSLMFTAKLAKGLLFCKTD